MLDLTFRPFYIPPLPRQPEFGLIVQPCLDEDDTYKYWGTLEHVEGCEFEFYREGQPERHGSFSLPEEDVPTFKAMIEAGWVFEVRIKKETAEIAGYSPRHKQLLDEATELFRTLARRYHEAEWGGSGEDPERLSRLHLAALKRMTRRYRGW
jgi:hypothetical protein